MVVCDSADSNDPTGGNVKIKTRSMLVVALITALLGLAAPMASAKFNGSGSTSNGQQLAKNDADNNGISDAGVNVTGTYKQTSDGCDYNVQYRGDFGNTPYLDSGEIINTIKCPEGNYSYTIVSQGDPRYTGNPDWAIWGTWEIVRYTEQGQGNLVHRPDRPGASLS